MEKRSSFEKALIAVGLALMLIGLAIALWAVPLVSAGEVILVELDTDENDFANVEYSAGEVSMRELTIGGGEKSNVSIEMFSGQTVEVEFEMDDDIVDEGIAIVIDKKGKIIGTYDFERGQCDIEFHDTGDDKEEYVVVFVAPDANGKYGINQEEQEFLQECQNRSAGKTVKQAIDAILLDLTGSASHGYYTVARVKIEIVKPDITSIELQRDRSDELEITAESNIPRNMDFYWKFFSDTMTRSGEDDPNSKGQIKIDIEGTKGVRAGKNCRVMIEVAGENFDFDLPLDEEDEDVERAFVELKSSKPKTIMIPASQSQKQPPTSKPTTTRVLADPPERAPKFEPTLTPETPMSGLCVVAALFVAMILRKKQKIKITGN